MLDLLRKVRRFLLGSISTKDLLILWRILLFGSVFIYSGLIYKFENPDQILQLPSNSQKFGNFWDALYFTVVTMATVGFGDVTPTSKCGHILTVLMIFTGTVLIPWELKLIDLIKQVVKTATQVEKDCLALDCDLAFHDVNAGFCKKCGAKLPT